MRLLVIRIAGAVVSARLYGALRAGVARQTSITPSLDSQQQARARIIYNYRSMKLPHAAAAQVPSGGSSARWLPSSASLSAMASASSAAARRSYLE